MQNIGISKAVGTYNFFFENRAEILVKTISKICTLSIIFVTFPNACKVLRLKPVFKKEKKTAPSKNNLQYNYQSGFRTNHWTNLCLLFWADNTLKSFDEDLLTAVILIDLQKPFITINKKIIFKKLKVMDFSEK